MLNDHPPGQAVLAVGGVVQFVVNHGAHRQRPRVAAEERHLASVQDPHGPLHVVQGPLQVGGLMGQPVQLEVQQGNACGADGVPDIRKPAAWNRCRQHSAHNRPVQPV